jgi:hypothetical protein
VGPPMDIRTRMATSISMCAASVYPGPRYRLRAYFVRLLPLTDAR